MNYLENFDFKNPDYVSIFNKRIQMLNKIRNKEINLLALKEYYKNNLADFISDWGCTVDYTASTDKPKIIPFILFEKQKECIDFILKNWQNNENGLIEKTRQMGISWVAMALSCSMCLFYSNIKIGFGSRKEEYVDKKGDSKSLFEKGRDFMNLLPKEFSDNWNEKNNSKYMQLKFNNGSTIIGEAGDNIGRGDTTSLYFVDESAFLERPQKAEASLSQGTRCRIDISTPNGINLFYQKKISGRVKVFTFSWRDDPRKDEAWYEKQKKDLDPLILAQEVDISYTDSVEGIVIPNAWIQSAIDAHIKLKFECTGNKINALDVADEGSDLNALCSRHGILVTQLEEWSGKNSDIGYTAQKAIMLCDNIDSRTLIYDADGLGAGIKGYIRIANEKRHNKINIISFRGSGAIIKPETKEFGDRLNKDFFVNFKAQAWWNLRKRFENTYNAIEKKEIKNIDELISIPSNINNFNKLISELSQPTYLINSAGKIVINKKPEGVKSPNLADALMMCFAPNSNRPLKINPNAFKQLGI